MITVEELSKLIGSTPYTVRKKCRERKIPCYKIDGMYKFRVSEIEGWLASQRQQVMGKMGIELVRRQGKVKEYR